MLELIRNVIQEVKTQEQALTEVFQVLPGNKLVVVIDGGLRAFLQLLCQVVEEGAPAGSRAQGLELDSQTHTRKPLSVRSRSDLDC